MRFFSFVLLAFAVVLCAARSVAADTDYTTCESSKTTTLDGADNTFGCQATGSRYWKFNRVFKFSTELGMDLEAVSYSMASDSQTRIQWYSPNGRLRQLSFNGNDIRLGKYRRMTFPPKSKLIITVYTGRGQGSSYSFKFVMKPLDAKVKAIQTGIEYDTRAEQSGGFVYAYLPSADFGKSLTVTMDAFHYSGLQQPRLFLAKDRLPTLEDFDWAENADDSGDDKTAKIVLPNPDRGCYFVGIKLYGRVSHASIMATWEYDIARLSNGVNEKGTTEGTNLYMFTVPRACPQFEVQVSRQVPGGEFDMFVEAGEVPTLTNNRWYTAITPENDYDYLNFPHPNPPGVNKTAIPNPGDWLISIECNVAPCGYIIQAAWTDPDTGLRTFSQIPRMVMDVEELM